MKSKRLATVAVVGFVVSALTMAETRQQSIDTIGETQAREWAAYAATKAAGDQKAFDQIFATLVRIVARSYRADPFDFGVTLYRTDALSLSVVGPVSDFQLATSEAVRKMLPVDKVPWPCGASVYVFPSRIDSPDIERIVVKRAGVVVEPKANHLLPQVMTTRMGVTFNVHAGSVCFAASTFAPGAEVTVIAIPVVGENIIKSLGEADLKMVV